MKSKLSHNYGTAMRLWEKFQMENFTKNTVLHPRKDAKNPGTLPMSLILAFSIAESVRMAGINHSFGITFPHDLGHEPLLSKSYPYSNVLE